METSGLFFFPLAWYPLPGTDLSQLGANLVFDWNADRISSAPQLVSRLRNTRLKT